jgi:flagellar FliL protein
MKYALLRRARQLALILSIGAALPLYAIDHGGGAAAGGLGPLKFTVNVGDTGSTMRFLQVELVLEFASPEAAQHMAAMKPKVQHRIIMLLTSEDIATLQTTKGKLELQERIADDLNALTGETVKTGVKEALLTSFVIQ